VLARLESEVPLGAFLRGGIDSGLIVSYMAEALGDRLVTASVGFADREHNELEAAALTGVALSEPALREKR
jgi:asparagine synthase (glutamine-hydrolysing)